MRNIRGSDFDDRKNTLLHGVAAYFWCHFVAVVVAGGALRGRVRGWGGRGRVGRFKFSNFQMARAQGRISKKGEMTRTQTGITQRETDLRGRPRARWKAEKERVTTVCVSRGPDKKFKCSTTKTPIHCINILNCINIFFTSRYSTMGKIPVVYKLSTYE